MSQYKSQIQNLFLSNARKKHLPVEVVLNTGTSLRGKVKGYDQFSITLVFKEKVEVIYKSAILFVTMLPRKPFVRPSSSPLSAFRRPTPPIAPVAPVAPVPPAAPLDKPGKISIDDGFGPAPAAPKPPSPPIKVPGFSGDDVDHDPPPPRKIPRNR